MATLIVVRRDANDTYRHFKLTWAHKLGNDLDLIWDRRTSDRRCLDASVAVEHPLQSRRDADAEPLDLDAVHRGERREHPESRQPERRRAERRQRAPDTWQTLDFVLVPQDRPATLGFGLLDRLTN
jgi:hypothetical protein